MNTDNKKAKNVFPDARNCSVKNNYTQISNNLIRDKRLSYKARGILILLLSHQEGWVSIMETLCDNFSEPDGRTSVESGMKELEKFGYLDKKIFKKKGNQTIVGSFIAYTDVPFTFNFEGHKKFADDSGWEIGDHPQRKNMSIGNPAMEKPSAENPSAENPAMENQQLIIPINNNTNYNNTNFNKSFSYEKEVIDSDESIEPHSQHVESNVCPVTEQEHNTVAQTSVAPDTVEQNNINVPPPRPTRTLKNPIYATPKPTPKIKKNIVSLIDYWNSLKIVQHRAGTKTYNEIAICLNKLMAGKFFDKNGPFKKYADYKFTEQEITNTMNRFSLAATDFNYEPTNGYKKTLKGTGIVHFLHNPFGEKEKSLFLEYFENEPVAVKETMRMIEDIDSNMTEIIKDVWVKKVMNKYVPKSYSKNDENNFRRATKEFHRWFNENNKRIHPQFGTRGADAQSKRKRVELFVEMLLKTTLTTSKIQISWLCSSYNWEHAFPKWCNDQGIMN